MVVTVAIIGMLQENFDGRKPTNSALREVPDEQVTWKVRTPHTRQQQTLRWIALKETNGGLCTPNTQWNTVILHVLAILWK